MNAHGRTYKMPPGSAGTNAQSEQKFTQLMRDMGSKTLDWNPEPDEHTTAILRNDITLSTNEMKFIACVKSCCTRKKPGGRTAWGKTESGEPLTLTRIADRLDWNISNAAKHSKRPLAWGFIRVDSDGVYGLSADVSGRIQLDSPTNSEEKAKDLNSLVCTYQLPKYVANDLKGLSQEKLEMFTTEWIHFRELAQRRLADAVAAVRKQEFEEQNALCKRFGTELRTRPKNEETERSPSVQIRFAEPDFNRYVHTSEETAPNKSVQTTKSGTYKPQKQSVQTDVSLLSSFEVLSSELASAKEQEQEAKKRETIADEVVAESTLVELPEGRPSDLEEAVYEAIHRSRLEVVGGKKVDPRTIRNICSHLERLQQIPEVKDVLEILEDKCRSLAQRTGEAQGKTWGWVVGVVRGEVNQRVGEPTDLRSALADLASRKVLR